MKIRLFKPFWSYDLPKTEAWLEEMAHDGFQLCSINLFFRSFTFEKSDPITTAYHINYDPLQNPLPKTLKEDGWKSMLQKGSWSFLCNYAQRNEVRSWPVRTAIHTRNNRLQYLFGGIGLLLSFLALVPIMFSLFAFMTFTKILPFGAPPSPVIFLLFVSVLVLSVYSFYKLRETNRKLLTELSSHPPTSHPLQTNKDLGGKHFVKWKTGWIYAPDKLEKWLEKMEAAGYHLKEVSPRGIKFYFVTGKPRLIKYQLDYRGTGKTGYMAIHRDAGWEDMFTSTSMFTKWTIWRQAYSQNEEPPIMHSDHKDAEKQARKVAIMYTCLFLPVLLLNIFTIYQRVAWQLTPSNSVEVTNVILQFALIALFGSFFVQSWLYYVRVRRRFRI